MQIDYTALRSIKSGHTVDLDYSIEVVLQQSDHHQRTIGKQITALAGNPVTTVHRRDDLYTVRTHLLTASSTPDLDDMREFLDSVQSGETFQMDISGSTEDYVLDSISTPFTETRVGALTFEYSFTARKV